MTEVAPTMIRAWQFTITCSCGATAAVRPCEGGRYECEDRRWKYHAVNDRYGDVVPSRSKLWHCVADGHYQVHVAEWGSTETDDGGPMS